jgi:cytoskeletal protein CcmA (bactofilin family)
MRIPRLMQTVSLVVLVLGASLTALLAQEAGQTVIKREPIEHDFYGVGETVHIAGPVSGDVVIAGQRLTLDGPVSEDVIAAGEIVTINGNVGDDIRAAGRLVQVNGEVGDHIVAAGETITLGPQAKVGSWAWLAGRQIEVLGQVGRQLKVGGEEVIIAGEVMGEVEIMAEEVRILADAVIHGPLRVHSPNPPEIATGARILGDVTHLPMPEVEHAPVLKVVALAGLVVTVSLILTGIVYFLLFPQFSVTAARHIEQVPLASLGLGFLVLLVGPLVILLLFTLGITFLLGILLAAAYFLMVVIGGLTGVIYVSDVALRRLFKKETVSKGLMVLTLIGAFVLLGLVQLIPLLGSLAVFLLSVLGIGALKYQFIQQYQAD